MPQIAEHSVSVRPPRASLAGATVLVAEDNLVNLEVARFHLEDLGCVAASAANGAEALELATTQAFDFILMDCQMPVMDGFAALAAIRALGAGHVNATTPILAVTAADDVQSKQACARAGFDGFLSKPFSAAQLQAALLGKTPAGTVAAAPVSDAAAPLVDGAAFKAFVLDFGVESAPSLIQSYVKLLADSIVRFDAVTGAQDLAGLQALGHKLAGASGVIGALRVGARAKDIDVKGKARQLAISDDVLTLRADLVATRALLEPMLTPSILQAFLEHPQPDLS